MSMLRGVGVKKFGRRTMRPITLMAAGVALFASTLPPGRAIAQGADNWFNFGGSPQRPQVRPRRSVLARATRQTDDDADRPQKHKRNDAAATEKDKPATGPLFAV